MPRIRGLLLSSIILISFSVNAGQKEPPLSLTEQVLVAGMAAKHDGFDITEPELTFRKLGGPDGSDYQIPGYTSVELYDYEHPVSIYTIRTATGDVINTFGCTLYRYPDLMKFRAERMKQTGSLPVSTKQIDDDLSCMGIKVKPAKGKSN